MLNPAPAPSSTPPLLSVQDLDVTYETGAQGFWGKPKTFKALEAISFDLRPGETLGLVGESGSGKTTAGRAILRRIKTSRGKILFNGNDITHVKGEALRKLRRNMQLVFQDPYASLNPRMRVIDIVAEPLMVHGLIRHIDEARDRITDLLAPGRPAGRRA